jgi:hypothetical protein
MKFLLLREDEKGLPYLSHDKRDKEWREGLMTEMGAKSIKNC